MKAVLSLLLTVGISLGCASEELLLRLEVNKRVFAKAEYIVPRLFIRNIGSTTVSIPSPREERTFGSRTPRMFWSIMIGRTIVSDFTALPFAPIGVCGVTGPFRIEDVVTLRPGDEVEVNAGQLTARLEKYGLFTLQVHYENDPNAYLALLLKSSDHVSVGEVERAVAGTVPVSLVSNSVIVEVGRPPVLEPGPVAVRSELAELSPIAEELAPTYPTRPSSQPDAAGGNR